MSSELTVDKIKADSLSVRSVTIVDEDGKSHGTLLGTKQGAGLWLTLPNGDGVAIHALGGNQTCLALMSHNRKAAHALAFHLDETGEPLMQIVKEDNSVVSVKLAEIASLVEAVSAKSVQKGV